ncbi:MAG: hypothetical protein SOZ89_06540 [Peptoniphilaceae bacterium]|nr:hypothetical protein [Peptoniphilaceae bacterium]MDD7383592.1 hypothetical protein [Peptoniphilaceae bacterium]MDY3738764.1 hypothetical protein [Peptoniphilaceae bacterium]
MDYTHFFTEKKEVKVGIIGATKGYGLTVLSQIKNVEKIKLRAISSRSIEDCRNILLEMGYPNEKIKELNNIEEISNLNDDDIVITTDYKILIQSGITSFIECTGNVELGLSASEFALKNNINVYMVSKETDSVCGPYLNKLASDNNTVYSLVNGDQPRNAIDLYSWAKINGFKVIAIGKSSEYDFVWDRENGKITYTDGSEKFEDMPEMLKYWRYEGIKTLNGRKKLLKDYINIISADLCEMNLVSNITGFKASDKYLNYPIIKTSELADVLIPEKDGGILKDTNVVDVFFQLREKDEASFAGGVFVIVECQNEKSWDMMRSKGHIVSKNGKYACLYNPFHIMGLETPISILLGDIKGIGTHKECKQVSVMAAYADKNFNKGDILRVSGHHHSIDGVIPALLEVSEARDVAPFYLLNGMKLKNDIKKGDYIKIQDVDLSEKPSYKAYLKGLNIN